MASDHGVTATPWPVPVRLSEIGRGLTRRLDADARTRAAIARVLQLQTLEHLEAEVTVAPLGDGYEVRGRIQAKLAQTCGLTLEPLPAEIDADFSVRCRTADESMVAEREIVISVEDDDPPDIIEGGAIDLGAYVVEHLALELDPFPRKPDAVFEPPASMPEPSPFAVLARLKPEDKP